MPRRFALTGPDILVELFEFAPPRRDSNPNGLAAEAILSCNVSPKPARKLVGVRSTPYPLSKPSAIYEVFQRKYLDEWRVETEGMAKYGTSDQKGSEFRAVHILQLSYE